MGFSGLSIERSRVRLPPTPFRILGKSVYPTLRMLRVYPERMTVGVKQRRLFLVHYVRLVIIGLIHAYLGRGGYHEEDVKCASAAKQKKERRKKRWLDNIMENMKEHIVTHDMAQNPSAWHMETNAGPLLHGESLYYNV